MFRENLRSEAAGKVPSRFYILGGVMGFSSFESVKFNINFVFLVGD
jgi:hypothetical protein